MIYSEFEGIEEMETGEKAKYLLGIVNRYTEVIRVAKEMLDTECLPEIESSLESHPGFNVRTRTTSSFDNDMLMVAYSDVYEDLYEKGKLVAKASDLKEYGEEVVANLITTKKSKWLEYK